LLPALREAKYPIEPAFGSEQDTVVVEVPVELDDSVRTIGEVSMWEQVFMGAFMQKHWADNMVSQTITFDPVTEGHMIDLALAYAQYHCKSVSFLPRLPQGAYAQMPYEAITAEEYDRRMSALGTLSLDPSGDAVDAVAERFCNNDSCLV
jgi:hypothetical protein